MSMQSQISLSRIHFPVTALGFGRRIGIWLQGCSIRCKGCIVPETWNVESGHSVLIESIFLSIAHWLAETDGVTISGGEPFDQPAALHVLLSGLRCSMDGDIVVYSGYSSAFLEARYPRILSFIDCLICEPFIRELEDERAFIGSANQTLTLLTALGHERYADLSVYNRRRDIAIEDAGIMMAGVPTRNQLATFRADLALQGITTTLTSARTMLERDAP